MLRLLPGLLAIAAVLWAATLVAAPYALMSGDPRLMSAAAMVYSGAGLICHQRAARSFHLAGVQLPVCARCAGLYISGAFGAALAYIVSRHPRVPSNTRQVLVLASIPSVLSVVLEWIAVVDPTNVGRALCALPLGASAAWIFVQSLRGEVRRIPDTASRLANQVHERH
ncbi:MAG: DUF2085 domain-containing protein [Vicinamibacterales bacterium]